MLILDSTGESIQAKLSAVPTTPMEVYAAFADYTSTTLTPGQSATTVPSNTDVDIVAAPGSSTQRMVKYLSVYNADSASAAVTIKHDAGGTERRLGVWTLDAGDTLIYGEGVGWYVMNALGARKELDTIVMPMDGGRRYPYIDGANLTAVKSLTSNSTFAVYMGRAESAYSSIIQRFRVTTAAATITWAEVGVAYSAVFPFAANASLTLLGYTDVAATINSIGQKSVAVSVSGVLPGMHLWALFGAQATTAAIVRGALADDLQCGHYQVAAATRPSTMGAGKAFTVEGATTVPVWGAWFGS